MNAYRFQQRGVTLIELLMSLIVLSVLLGIAAPAFGSLLASTHMRSAQSQLSVALNEARITAASRNANVIVCPSPDRQHCERTTRWNTGWLVFLDRNRDGAHDAGEPVISLAQEQPKGLAIVSSVGRKLVTYRPDGSATGSNLTLTFCDRRGTAYASALILNNAGRLRSGVPSKQAAATACALVDG
ncbi:MAG: GspH/FimT family pseudopilin [Rhodanobacteraceae bacterium]